MIHSIRKILAAAFLAIMTVATATAANVRVIDGDTIEADGIIYRLHGIDAPEAGQKCNRGNGRTWPCGQVAIKVLEELVLFKDVNCVGRDKDQYGRTIAICRIGSDDINARMVSSGNAWAFRKFSTDYVALEDIAKKMRIGIWQADTQTAWDYRAERWAVAKQQAPEGCPIKGNISGNGNIYHPPWSPWYDRTKVSLEKGERWFCSEDEAIAAGWRAPYWGR